MSAVELAEAQEAEDAARAARGLAQATARQFAFEKARTFGQSPKNDERADVLQRSWMGGIIRQKIKEGKRLQNSGHDSRIVC